MRGSAHASRSHAARWCAILIACLAAHATPAAVPDTISTEIVHVRFKTEMSLAALDSFATEHRLLTVTALEPPTYKFAVDRYTVPVDTTASDIADAVIASGSSVVDSVSVPMNHTCPGHYPTGFDGCGISLNVLYIYWREDVADSTRRDLATRYGLIVRIVVDTTVYPGGVYGYLIDRAVVPFQITAQTLAELISYRHGDVVLFVEPDMAIPAGGGGAVVSAVPGWDLSLSSVPNPFNPSTAVRYALESPGIARLTVYTIGGQPVRVLVPARHVNAGSYTANWDGTDSAGRAVATGVYIVRLTTPTRALAQSVTLLR